MSAVHQFLPTWEPGAIGSHAVEVRRALQDVGVNSDVFVDDIKGGLPVSAYEFEEYGASVRASSQICSVGPSRKCIGVLKQSDLRKWTLSG